MKSLVGIATCGLASFAQFNLVKYPESRDAMIACIAGYFFLSAAMHTFVLVFEQRSVLYPTAKVVSRSCSIYMISVHSKLSRFSEHLQLVMKAHGGGLRPEPTRAETVIRVCDYTYEDGSLAYDKFTAVVYGMIRELEAGAAKTTI